MPHRRCRKSAAIFLCGMMCLFLWQASIYPVQGQWSKKGGEINNAKDNALRSITVGIKKLIIYRSSEPQISTYEIIVNNDVQSLDTFSKSTLPDNKDDGQKRVTQKAVPLETESQILSRSLGRLVSKEDVELITRVIYGEARGENFEGQVAVGAVILNRLKDPRFPKTIRAVIYQAGAFTAVDDRQIHLNPDDEAYKAAEAALSGLDPTNGAIYYYNPRIATDRWIKSRPVIKRIGNHTFSI